MFSLSEGKANRAQVHLVCMKKSKNEEFEREGVTTYIIAAILG